MILQTYKRPKSIAHGKDGCIFQIAKGLVAKIGYGEAKTQHDAKIAERLYAEGISVPVPYGVNPVTFPAKTIQDAFSGRTINGFVMDKVIGKTGFQLRGLGLEIIDEAYIYSTERYQEQSGKDLLLVISNILEILFLHLNMRLNY